MLPFLDTVAANKDTATRADINHLATHAGFETFADATLSVSNLNANHCFFAFGVVTT